MDIERDLRRRVFLGSIGAGIAGLAGCTAQQEQSTETEPDPTTTRAGTARTTATATHGGSHTETGTDTPTDTPVDDGTDKPRDPPRGSGDPDDWTGLNKGEVLDSFEAFEEKWQTVGGSATPSDTINYGSGTAVFMTSEGDSRATIRRTFDSVRDFSETGFSMAVRLDGTTAGTVQPILMLRDLFGNRRLLSGSVHAQATDRWVRLDLGVRRDEGTDMSAIKEIRVHLHDGDNTTRFFVDDIRTHDTPDAGYVMFTFDDAHTRDYTVAFPTLQERGYQGAFFPQVNNVGRSGSPTVSEYLEMQDHGWDVGGHTLDHERLSTYTKREQQLILERNKMWLEENGFTHGARFFRTPYSAYDSHTLDLMPQFFDLSIVGAGSAKGINFEVTDPRTVGFREGDDYDRAKSLIDAAVEYKQLLGLTIHMSKMNRRRAFEDLIAHAAAHERNGRLEIITPSTLLDDHIRA